MFSVTQAVADVGDALYVTFCGTDDDATMAKLVYEKNMLRNIGMRARIVCSFGLNARILLILHSLKSRDS